MEKNIDFDIVADLYDAYVNTDMDIGFYMELCRGRKSILELMCGTGRISMPLIREGFRMTCVDYSEGMLNVFRKKLKENEQADILCQDICHLQLNNRYDLAFIPFNSISEITDGAKRKQALKGIYEYLLPGGLFFCTLYNPAYRIKLADGNLAILGKFDMECGRSLVVSFYNVYSEKDKNISGMQFYEIYDACGKLSDKRALEIRFSVISKDEMLEAAENAGFAFKEIYGDYDKRPFYAESRFMNFLFQRN
jgi:SAM-dependent methyltransferase